jgi:methionyl aminopeptidase
MSIESPADLAALKHIGQIVGEILQVLRAAVRPGITTGELDALAGEEMRKRAAESSPKLVYQFPGEMCISVNDEVVHGVPGPRVLQAGDVLKVDVTAELDGYIADAARTIVIPPATAAAKHLVACAESAFNRALVVAMAGVRISELGRAVESEVQRWGHAVIHDMCGHGVGRALHEQPSVPNFFSLFTPGRLQEGLVIALEPIIAESPTGVYEAADGWTLCTTNGSLAAHFEHTIMIHEGKPEILTAA